MNKELIKTYFKELANALYNSQTLLEAQEKTKQILQEENNQTPEKRINSKSDDFWNKAKSENRVALIMYDPGEDYYKETANIFEKSLKDNYPGVQIIKVPVSSKADFNNGFKKLKESCKDKEVMIYMNMHGAGENLSEDTKIEDSGKLGFVDSELEITEDELRKNIKNLKGEKNTTCLIQSCYSGRFLDMDGLLA